MSWDITIYQCRIRLTEPLLGTVPKNPDVYREHVQAKARERLQKVARMADGTPNNGPESEVLLAEEIESVEHIEEKGWTGFHTDDDGPFLYSYVLKGNLSAAAYRKKTHGALKQLGDKCKGYVFIKPRKIRLPAIELEPLERPLRAMTAQGPRVTVTRSDIVASGTELEFQIHVLAGGGITKPILHELLSYGQYYGLGQWRSGGYGQYEVVELKEV